MSEINLAIQQEETDWWSITLGDDAVVAHVKRDGARGTWNNKPTLTDAILHEIRGLLGVANVEGQTQEEILQDISDNTGIAPDNLDDAEIIVKK